MAKKQGELKLSQSNRIIIEHVTPQIDDGKFPVKRVSGQRVVVRADIFADGHDQVSAVLLYRTVISKEWTETRMKDLGNDAWIGSFTIDQEVNYVYTVRGYINEFSSWRHDLEKRVSAGQDLSVDLKIGARIITDTISYSSVDTRNKLQAILKQIDQDDIKKATTIALGSELLSLMEANLDKSKSFTYTKELQVVVDRKKAQFSAWYEFFPRSCSTTPGQHGTFKDCQRILPDIARMGFDVVYLPPVHPIGKAFRKGKNNATTCQPDEPGCPWAIGGAEGGHKSVHPQLGTIADFKDFVNKANTLGLDIALDIALQCSPDHPYLKQHPDWFKWRPDGTVQYAENPPKKYEDVLPFNFDTADKAGLWEEIKSIFLFWADQGVTIFRVDNPHTKPFELWDWVIAEVKNKYPDAIFLAEAFTRPKVMYRLAKGGFTHSYTYFTWRNTKREFEEYLTELAQSEVADYFRPNFWPNTPDIFPEQLQYGGRPAYAMRAVLAATLSSNYGVYGPAFELCVKDALPGREEYLDSEKYEIKHWDMNAPVNIRGLITQLNSIRRDNPALQLTRNIRFCRFDNDQMLAYYKATGDYSNILLMVVNLDPYHVQSGWLQVPLQDLGINKDRPYTAENLLTGEKYIWQGESIQLSLDPHQAPAFIVRLSKELRREEGFDFFL